MEKTKKKPNLLLVLLIVFLVLAVVYFAASKIIAKVNDDKETADALNSTITGIFSVSNISFETAESSLHFVQDGSVWVNEENPDFPLKEASMTKTASYFTDLEAIRTLDTPAALSEYGLDNPRYTVLINAGAADAETVRIGNDASTGVYVKVDSKDAVYVVDAGITDYVITDVYSVLKYDALRSFLQSEVTKMTLEYGGSTYVYELNSEGDGTCDATRDGKNIDVSYDAVAFTLDLIDNWKLIGCEKYQATDEDFASYGFGEEQFATITLDVYDVSEDESFTITLRFGGIDSTAAYRYAEFDNNRQIVYGNMTSVDDIITNVTVEGLTEFVGGADITDLIDTSIAG